jgi:GrpB-like predicted nucleotidyltransferase (UPF0157 family)
VGVPGPIVPPLGADGAQPGWHGDAGRRQRPPGQGDGLFWLAGRCQPGGGVQNLSDRTQLFRRGQLVLVTPRPVAAPPLPAHATMLSRRPLGRQDGGMVSGPGGEAGRLDDETFAAWCRLRESQGPRVSLLRLYEMVAEARGLSVGDLPLAERRILAERAIAMVFPGWHTLPGTGRPTEPIEIVPYDPGWATLFEAWRERLAGRLGPVADRIDHVGSTSVPGLAAKPIVDIQVSVADLEREDDYVPACEATGLQLHSRDREHRYFRPPAGWPREVHLHVCTSGGDWERLHLLFRDFLRVSPQSCEAYAAMKRQAARDWRDDRLGYTEAKNDLILDLLAEAERWAAAEGWAPGRRAAPVTQND